MKVYNKEGIEMMDVKSIDLDGDKLIVKGKIMGAMATTLVLRPRDLWAAWGLLGRPIVWALPRLMWQGWRASRQAAAQPGGSQGV